MGSPWLRAFAASREPREISYEKKEKVMNQKSLIHPAIPQGVSVRPTGVGRMEL
jgi:hypothetical protein